MYRLRALRNLPRLKFSCASDAIRSLPVVYRLCFVSLSTDNRFDISKDNIILMGSPGCGKSTIGTILSKKLGTKFLNIKDHLESYWNTSVAEKLSKLGSEGFIQAEGECLLKLNVSNTVVALSSSNPMHSTSMEHIRQTGLVIYLDVKTSNALEHLQKMKVNHVVGHEAGISMEEILQQRQQFYENSYDVRIICGAYESAEDIADKVLQAMDRLDRNEGYVSTRSDMSSISQKTFNDILFEDFAPDGGLYVPAGALPYFTKDQWLRLVPLTFAERAQRILEQWLLPADMHPSDISVMVKTAYERIAISLQKLHEDKIYKNEYMLELFHGPTASVKDVSLQLAPVLFQHAMFKTNTTHRYLILVATSDDTGAAVLDGFSKLEGSDIRVMVLYPEDDISAIRKTQMTSIQAPNVKVIGVKGGFDNCQTLVKTAINDKKLGEELLSKYNCKLSTMSSVNWGWLVPQIIIHASSYLDLVKLKKICLGQEVDFCMPTGNFGNMLAAYYARKMGIPYRYFICASNKNNILTEFFNTGHYAMRSRKLHKTSSPAIDVLMSSNLERFLYHVLNEDSDKVRNMYQKLDTSGYFSITKQELRRIQGLIRADWSMESSASRSILNTYKKTGYLMDPHTAVAMVVSDKFRDDHVPRIIASTAHYAKSAPDVLASLGYEVDSMKDFSCMFRDLEKLTVRPTMHQTLKQNILKPIVHKTLIQPNITDMVNEMKTFLSTGVN